MIAGIWDELIQLGITGNIATGLLFAAITTVFSRSDSIRTRAMCIFLGGTLASAIIAYAFSRVATKQLAARETASAVPTTSTKTADPSPLPKELSVTTPQNKTPKHKHEPDHVPPTAPPANVTNYAPGGIAISGGTVLNPTVVNNPTPPPRTINGAAFANALAGKSIGSIDFLYFVTDAETQQLTDAVGKALMDAHIPIVNSISGMATPPVFDLTIGYPPAAEARALLLQNAFQAAGLATLLSKENEAPRITLRLGARGRNP